MEYIIYDSENDTEGIDFSYEQGKLNVELDGGYGSMIVIADLGLWDGRHKGYRMMGGRTVNMAFSAFQGDFYKLVYDSDTDDVKGVDHHHDGTNYYTFREVRKGKDISELQDLIYSEKATQEDIDKYTKPLGKYVRKIYGWKRTRPKKAA
jgi:hypothetical protein